jgi:hypothetical protein
MKYLLLLLLSISSFAVNAKPVTLELKDGAKLEAVTSESRQSTSAPRKKFTVSVKYQSIEGLYLSTGKALAPLDTGSIRKLQLKHRSFARDVSKIHSAYELIHQNEKLYISGLNSITVPDGKSTQCYETKTCLADFDVALVELKTDSSSQTVVILKSIRFR